MLQRLTSKKIQRCGCCTGTVGRDKTSVKQVEEIFRDKANDVERRGNEDGGGLRKTKQRQERMKMERGTDRGSEVDKIFRVYFAT